MRFTKITATGLSEDPVVGGPRQRQQSKVKEPIERGLLAKRGPPGGRDDRSLPVWAGGPMTDGTPQRRAEISAMMSFLGLAPEKRACSSPSLKKIIVGMLITR